METAQAQKPLYEDSQFKIDYHPTSVGDHVLYMGKKGYVLQKGTLTQLATSSRQSMERLLEGVDTMLLFHAEYSKINLDSLHAAICNAYQEEQKQVREFTRQMRKEMKKRSELRQ